LRVLVEGCVLSGQTGACKDDFLGIRNGGNVDRAPNHDNKLVPRPMKMSNERPKAKLYLVLFAVQVLGALTFVWQELPEFRQVAVDSGKQLPYNASSDLMTVGILLVMQIAFWYRQLHVPIPFRRPNVILNHVLLFLGRLSFIFGSALFSVVVFRHLPELGRETDLLLLVGRGTILVGCLFALFCSSLEVERLGQAFEANRH
jgi:hypothetical protein